MSTSPAPVTIRPAQRQEAARVAWLAALTFPLACPPRTPRAEVARHIATHLTPSRFAGYAESPAHLLLVADGGTTGGPDLLGYALLHLGHPGGEAEAALLAEATGSAGPYVELSKIYAHPSALGTEVSSLLMRGVVEGAVELASAHGREPLPLWLGTNRQNLRARAFYGKHGFVVVGARTYDVGGQQHDDVVMLRRG